MPSIWSDGVCQNDVVFCDPFRVVAFLIDYRRCRSCLAQPPATFCNPSGIVLKATDRDGWSGSTDGLVIV